MTFAAKTWAVLKKDFRSELRAKYALNSTLLFSFTCVFVVSFSMSGSVADTRIVAAMLWIIFFFSAMTGLARAFVKEEDQGTMSTLRLVCEPAPLFIGKTLANFILLAITVAIVTPLFLALMNATLLHTGFFVLGTTLAAVGMSATCTLLSALVTGARGRGMLFPILAFPVLLPVFWIAVSVTDKALSKLPPWEDANLLTALGSYAGVSVILGIFLFEFLFSE